MPATPRRGSPIRCARAGVKAGDRVALICSNRLEFLQVVLGCAWLGAVAVPINVASRGPQLQHILGNCGAKLLVIEAAYAENLDMLEPDKLAVETLWLIGEGVGPSRQHRRATDAARRRADRGGGGEARRSRTDPLHVRHHRAVEGRLLPAGAVLLVGGQHRIAAGDQDRRRAVHQPAAVPHQRAQHLLSGAADRQHRALREAVLGVGLLFRRWSTARRPSPICSAPWCRSCCRGR